VKKMARVVIKHFFARVTYAIFCNKCKKRKQNCVKKRTFFALLVEKSFVFLKKEEKRGQLMS